MEVFDVYSTDDLQGFLKAKRAEGWDVVGTVCRPEDVEDVPVISCSEFQWDKPLIVVIGSEGEGLSLETQLQCHRMLAIPPGRALHPGIDSLNVSVAAGILLHSICTAFWLLQKSGSSFGSRKTPQGWLPALELWGQFGLWVKVPLEVPCSLPGNHWSCLFFLCLVIIQVCSLCPGLTTSWSWGKMQPVEIKIL
uniref:tRNA/rRNA methyltransferase SpoU type domain-containing protein n=1 Tax=Zosterops lateralis melanops TaxID=1220523 RepID=A0A8D2PHQ3_ZOSLA